MEGFSGKVVLLVISIFSTSMIGIVSWIGINVVETSISISAINAVITSEFPRLVNELAIVKVESNLLQKKVLVLETKIPYLINTIEMHIKEHPKPKEPDRDIYMKGNSNEVKIKQ